MKASDPDFRLDAYLSEYVLKQKEQGIIQKKATVTLDNVTVVGDYNAVQSLKSMGDLVHLPVSIYNRITGKEQEERKALRNFRKNESQNKHKNVIQNCHGIVEPGEMCLVIGRPGSGCTTFLKAITGIHGSFKEVKGEVSFDNITQKDFLQRYQRDVIYNGELDTHFPHLTVEQTFDFAIRMRTPAKRVDDMDEDSYLQETKTLWAKVFGLTHTFHTKVGNEYVRGVSGGERKRISLAEAMFCNGIVYCWDNATRGLDASTALEFAETVRSQTTELQTTTFATLYQAGENIYEKFDKVTVMYEGKQIFFGSIASAKQYFLDMGWETRPRQTTSEFLTSVTDPIARLARRGWESRVPHTSEEFEAYWLQSPQFAELRKTINSLKGDTGLARSTASTFEEATKEEISTRRPFTAPIARQMKASAIREYQNIIGNKVYTIALTISSIMQSLLVGSLFYNMKDNTTNLFSRGGAVFFALLFFVIMAFASLNQTFQDRAVLTKLRTYSMTQPAVDILSTFFLQLPLRLAIICVFSIIYYFLAHLKVDAGAFFTFILFIFLCQQIMISIYAFIASLCGSFVPAIAIAGMYTNLSVLYSSYLIHRPDMKVWFKWISYLLPILYAFESTLTTELHGRETECTSIVPSGEGYSDVSSSNQACAFEGSYGGTSVNGDNYAAVSYDYYFSHVWRNFGILILFWVSFLTLHCVVATFRPIKDTTAGGSLTFTKHAKVFQEMAEKQYVESDVEAGEYIVADNKESGSERSEQATPIDSQNQFGSNDVFFWKDLNYDIPYEKETRRLLSGVSGYVEPGTLTALMGESGAGKTTLLNVLSQRVDIGVVSGEILVNARPVSASFPRRTGYVQQENLHIPQLTVRELLQFSARLRRPASVPDFEKLEYVETIIKTLKMEHFADAMYGVDDSGLNVEQRKKVSIATELVAKPSLLLFLDEPTSGLDSESSWAIVKLLRQLAHSGQAILCTIHQPSAILFEQFDRLLLLQKGGKTVYFGDIGKHSATVVDYFHKNGARKCDDQENPAEYILESIGAGATAVIEDDWSRNWLESENNAAVMAEIRELERKTKDIPVDENPELLATYTTSYWYQFRMVYMRACKQFARDLIFFRSLLSVHIFTGLIYGFSLYDVKTSLMGMQDLLLISIMSIITSIPSGNQLQSKCVHSRNVFEGRESKSRIFHWSLLLMTNYLAVLPYLLFFSTVYFCCFYFPLRIDTSAHIAGVWWLTYAIFFQLYSSSLSMAIFYVSANLPTANVIFNFLFNMMISFCGLMQPVALMPGFWHFMYRVSPHTYFVQNFVSILIHGRQVECSSREITVIQPPSGETCSSYLNTFLENSSGYISNPDATSNCEYCPYKIGDQFLSSFGMSFSYRWRNIGLFVAYILFNWGVTFIAYYWFRVRPRKH